MAASHDAAPLAHLWTRLETWVAAPGRRELLGSVLPALLAAALFLVGVRLVNRLLRRALAALDARRLPGLKVQSLEVVSAERVTDVLKAAARAVRALALLALLYVFVPAVLGLFPWTRPLMARALPWIVAPVAAVVRAVVDFLPHLAIIVAVVVVARYLMRFTRVLFAEVEKGSIVFPGFHRQWAAPTAKLVSAAIVVFAVILVSPQLPGFGSPAFQGVSIFLGVLLSLGSTAVVANLVAGIALIYMRSFAVGDRVRIADTTGDVVERSMLMTRLRTVKNVEVTIPNALVLANQMVNYSTLAAERGLILHTSVTIGYDVPWRRIDALLTGAAAATEHVEAEPAPFVLQTALDDFAVAYELNVYVRDVHCTPQILSALHRNVQDRFAEAGIEILSPHYTSVRDGNAPALPKPSPLPAP